MTFHSALATLAIPACLAPATGTELDGTPGLAQLSVETDAAGASRFSALVQVGDSPPFEALVDTGSSGLRLLPNVVSDAAFTQLSTELVSASFDSGLSMQGVLATGTVTIAGLATPQPIPIMRVTAIGCTPELPACDAASSTIDNYQLYGQFRAILGVGMRNTTADGGIANPIVQLAGNPAFVVRAPNYGGTVGVLDIGPTKPETFSETQLTALTDGVPLANGAGSWDDRAVPTCIANATTGASYCGGAILDTATPETKIDWQPFTGAATTWPGDTQVNVSVGKLASYTFTVGATPAAGLDEVIVQPQTGTSQLDLGTAVFFRNDVLFDQARGVIGLAAHAPTP